jgi:precorrin-6Y C5,15-methyltransferase (decarboxylating)
MMTRSKESIIIVGTGLSRDDISLRALAVIEDAEILIGGRRQLAFFPLHNAEKIEIKGHADTLLKSLKKRLRGKNAVVLASGDPNFFGIAALFYKYFDKDKVFILPNITAFQEAFARIKEPWHEAAFISVHGREISSLDKILQAKGIFVIYCDGKNTPAAVADYLISKDKGLGACRAWVFDSLGKESEEIISATLKKVQKCCSSALCMMVIKKEKAAEKHGLGIPDKEFCHQRGMITKKDVRILSLTRLGLQDKLVLWDIGAGSGSLSIEAASLYPGLKVYAVEKNSERFKELQKNLKKHKLPNLCPVIGSAPDALRNLPLPDSLFIGGTGGRIDEIMKFIKSKIRDKGHVVVNCVTMETLIAVRKLFQKWQWQYEITEVQLSYLASGTIPEIFRAENPVFIVHGCKQS